MNTLPFAQLRTHSYFSFLGSLCAPKDLVEIAQAQRMSAIGLTDYRHLTGAIDFYETCKTTNIKPIIGLEIDLDYQGQQGKFTLFAKDLVGWSNLCRLSTHMLAHNSLITIGDLEKHQSGLIGLVGDPRGVLKNLIQNRTSDPQLPNRFLEDLKSFFFEDLFIEVQRFDTGRLKNENSLVEMAHQLNIPIIASQNIFYTQKEDTARFQTLTAIKHNTPIQNLSALLLPPGSAHFPDHQDFAHRFADIPEALANIQMIIDQCNLELPLGQTHFPAFPTPDGVSPSAFLRDQALAGAKKCYGNLTSEILDRLDHELNIISEMGYEPIFLIVQDVLKHARKLGIPTSSRGSAASSLVAHCLEITSPDPITLNLYFERFLNPARKKPPDIDTDISSERRDEVIQYVFDTYGADRVAMVGTINRYRPKSALGDVAKAYGLSPETIRQLSKKLPSSFRFQQAANETDPFSPLLRESLNPIIKEIIADARSILDIPHHLSVHPGGIVIAPFPITNLIPLVHSDSLGINHAQFDLEGIEKFGMVKIDLLGIRGLSVMGDVAEKIHSWHITEFSNGLDVLDRIPADDRKTTGLIEQAKTIGCFQIESPGMRATLKEIKARTPEDIMAALALYRPGPLKGGLRDAFVRRFKGEEPVVHLHHSLSDLLQETYGVILYQEQVLRIAHELGGLSIAQADILRRAMSHFNPGSMMETLRKHFIDGAMQRKGVPEDTALQIWDMMAAFAGYGFPKAHAASYAQLAWNSAWCKAHYPAEFMAAVLGFGGGYYSQRVYLMEARRLGLTIKPPHINHSLKRFNVKYPDGQPILYMGLNQVRDLTQHTIERIIRHRPYHSFEDFILRSDPHRKELENLIKCNALEGLISIPDGLNRITHQHPRGQLALFTPPQKEEGEWTGEQQRFAQEEILGVSLDISPLERFAEQISNMGAISTIEAEARIGESVCVAGMRQTLRRYKNRSGQMMCFLSLEDLEGSLQVHIPASLYAKHYQILQSQGPFLVQGHIEQNQFQMRTWLMAEKISLLN